MVFPGFFYFQGHPEYDHNSLFKEYKREVVRFLNGEISDYPPYPDGYFLDDAKNVLRQYQNRVMNCSDRAALAEEFPESDVIVHNTWGDTGKVVFNNWLGTIYQITHRDRPKAVHARCGSGQPLGLDAEFCPFPFYLRICLTVRYQSIRFQNRSADLTVSLRAPKKNFP
ncbi:MAG: hypothetical protein Ct9H300mP16_07230 [Pseudomonadota bacterium]|nr:MAG: hypothetical protein Ct9H300mP16_07230 [Pseudomonadota bacterium]